MFDVQALQSPRIATQRQRQPSADARCPHQLALATQRCGDSTWGLASSAPTRRTQSAWEMQMRDQGVTAASASKMMNLRHAGMQ